MLGSNDLHALYLDPAEAVAGLLDPGSPTVAAALQAATSRVSGDPLPEIAAGFDRLYESA